MNTKNIDEIIDGIERDSRIRDELRKIENMCFKLKQSIEPRTVAKRAGDWSDEKFIRQIVSMVGKQKTLKLAKVELRNFSYLKILPEAERIIKRSK